MASSCACNASSCFWTAYVGEDGADACRLAGNVSWHAAADPLPSRSAAGSLRRCSGKACCLRGGARVVPANFGSRRALRTPEWNERTLIIQINKINNPWPIQRNLGFNLFIFLNIFILKFHKMYLFSIFYQQILYIFLLFKYWIKLHIGMVNPAKTILKLITFTTIFKIRKKA